MKIPANKTLATLRTRAFPGAEATAALDFQQRLDASQWQTADELRLFQLQHLRKLARFAATTTEAYAGRLDLAAIDGARSLREALDLLPILSRDAFATNSHAFQPSALPPGHTLSGTKRSSGTSGQVVSAEVTNVTFGWHNALSLRSYLWSGWDFSKSFAGIRVDFRSRAPYPEGATFDSWGAPSIFPFPTGQGFFLGTKASLDEQWEWLERRQPAYLITYPSIISAFSARAAEERHGPCRLHGIATVGESVDADLRDAAKRHLGTEIRDVYSAEEIGTIACQCPTSRRYHTQDEAIIVEILDDEDRPCRPGQVGRVVLTPLHNYATPLLRYDIGDLAEAGVPCACGRGLGTINRIVGRTRNIFRLADGRTFWPSGGARSISSLMRVRQHQFRQIGYDHLEVVLATPDTATPEIEARMRETIQKRMPAPMRIDFRYVDSIPREDGGKYQEFLCLVK